MIQNELIGVDTARTLANVALLAAWEGDSAAAEYILMALQAAKPNEANIRVCRAMVFACRDRHAESIALLNGVLHDDPENVCAKALLGYVMFSAGEQGWDVMLEDVVRDGSDRASVDLAQQILMEGRVGEMQAVQVNPSGSHLIPYA